MASLTMSTSSRQRGCSLAVTQATRDSSLAADNNNRTVALNLATRLLIWKIAVSIAGIFGFTCVQEFQPEQTRSIR